MNQITHIAQDAMVHMEKCINAPFEKWPVLTEAQISEALAGLSFRDPKASKDQAKDLIKMLFGCYPNHRVADEEIYSRAVVSVLMDYPQRVGVSAIQMVTLGCKYMPTRKEVNDACKAEVERQKSIRAVGETMRRKRAKAEQGKQDAVRLTDDQRAKMKARCDDLLSSLRTASSEGEAAVSEPKPKPKPPVVGSPEFKAYAQDGFRKACVGGDLDRLMGKV